MQFDHPILIEARGLVQAVDVLRDHRIDFLAVDKSRQSQMPARRLRAAIDVVHRELSPP